MLGIMAENNNIPPGWWTITESGLCQYTNARNLAFCALETSNGYCF